MRPGAIPSVPRPAASARPDDLVVRLGAGDAAEVAAVGGKGASLDRLTRLGHAVPAAMCVTAAAFRTQLDALLARVPDASAWLSALPDEAARRSLVEAFAATPTAEPVRAAVARGVTGLVAEIAEATGQPRESTRPVRLAVRSSALDEDGAVASFAGLHETELGRTAAEVDGAIRRCWASLWSAPAVAYRARRGGAASDACMAVVIQGLVPADASAVVFTRHPVIGRADHVLVTAIRGLGEPMVSGIATPDTIVVDRASRAIVEQVPGRPGPRLFDGDDGPLEMPDPGVGPALDGTVLRDLVDLAIRVDDASGGPVDVEAALVGRRWFLLQARPITNAR
jgi:pyruvate,water dikinase